MKPFTVAGLIARLSQLDPSLTVVTFDGDGKRGDPLRCILDDRDPSVDASLYDDGNGKALLTLVPYPLVKLS